MLFSVIIPTYNRRELLEKALESVWAQHFTDYEIIVVDDGSTDCTAEWLGSLGGRLQVLKQTNQGPSAARNLGASRAKGEYLAFLDSDDLWFPWTLATYAQSIWQHGKPAMLRACWMEYTETTHQSPVLCGLNKHTLHNDYLAAGDVGVYVGAGLIAVRRDAFHKVEGFDTTLHCSEEHDLALRMGVMEGFVEISSPCQVAYRRHGVSATQNLNHMIHGSQILIAREKANMYPGGDARRAERRGIITLATRPISLACLRLNRQAEGWSLFVSALPWSILQGRWKYLLGFPVLTVRWWLQRVACVK